MNETYNAWIITEDHISSATGQILKSPCIISGPKSITDQELERLKSGEGYQFRMFDDDGILYYVGRCFRQEFDPLTDFGTPGAGCTEIQYYSQETEGWETL